MTLIIAVLCKDGAAILADRRSRIIENGNVRFDDSYSKILRRPSALVYNHGYNRIRNRDWKESGDQLDPDEKLPVYAEISTEMLRKPDKHSAYVFAAPRQFVEISIDAGSSPRLHQIPKNHDRLLSGSGKDFVDLSPLSNLSLRSLDETTVLMESVFHAAHRRLTEAGGTHFSDNYDIETIQG